MSGMAKTRNEEDREKNFDAKVESWRESVADPRRQERGNVSAWRCVKQSASAAAAAAGGLE